MQEGCTMTEPSVSFAGNLTEDPEVRYTDGGIARAMFRAAVSGRRSRSHRSSP
jgi:single-stranded DNA-binding protein